MNSQFTRTLVLGCFALLLGPLLQAQEQKLHVVASFLPLYAHTKSIAGDLADVEVLLSKETGPHDYELKPSDVQKLARTDLFIANGVGLEEWLDDLIQKSGNQKLTVVDSSQGVELLDNPRAVSLGTPQDHGDNHDHGSGKNPHLWLDPVAAGRQVETITAALAKADPPHAAAYRQNANAYLAALKKLDEDFAAGLKDLPNRNLITFHDAFPYLAKRYGLNYIGFIEEFPEKDPKPRELASLVRALKDNKVKVVFAESGYSPKLLKSIADQSGARVASLNTLEVGAPSADAYLVLMRENLKALEQAWK